MPNIDLDAKAWQEAGSKRFGQAVASLRVAQGLTAVQLSARTKELGYPITRSTIARIEGNHRAGKVDLAELIILAAALNTSPVNLVYPGPYQSALEIMPGRNAAGFNAAQWFSGIYSYLGNNSSLGAAEDPETQWRENTETLYQWRDLDELIATRDEMDNPEHIAVLNRRIKAICERLGISVPTAEVDLRIEHPADDSHA